MDFFFFEGDKKSLEMMYTHHFQSLFDTFGGKNPSKLYGKIHFCLSKNVQCFVLQRTWRRISSTFAFLSLSLSLMCADLRQSCHCQTLRRDE